MPSLHMKSRADRSPIDLEASVTTANRSSMVKVTDVTADGCCVTGTYKIGEWLSIVLPGTDELRAQVRWTIFDKAGLRFDRRLEL